MILRNVYLQHDAILGISEAVEKIGFRINTKFLPAFFISHQEILPLRQIKNGVKIRKHTPVTK